MSISGWSRKRRIRIYHSWMQTSGTSFDPTQLPPRLAGPVVDYRLARRSVLVALRRGTLHSTDVCDAHPELLRAAKNIGHEGTAPCPVCSHESLKFVRYVYGDELKRNNGRVVYPAEWLSELVSNHDHFTCYVVEVCVDCAWNHLVRAYVTGRRYQNGSNSGPSTSSSVPPTSSISGPPGGRRPSPTTPPDPPSGPSNGLQG
jgi:hypothetical protein